MDQALIKLPSEGRIDLRTYGEVKPIAVAAYSPEELQRLNELECYSYLFKFSTEEMCQWCIANNLKYQFLYDTSCTFI